MPNYIFKNGQLYEVSDELEHGLFKRKGQPRKDHKYIKREWKNGRWVYTYDLKQNVKDKIGITAKEKLADAGLALTRAKGNVNKGKLALDTSRNRLKLTQYKKSSLEGMYEDSVKDYENAGVGTGEGLVAALKEISAEDKVKFLENHQQNRKRSNPNYESTKEYKEKEYELSAAKHDLAVAKLASQYLLETDKAIKKQARDRMNESKKMADKVAPEERKAIVERSNAAKEYQKVLKEYEDAGKRYLDAQEAYMNTPLGKLDKVLEERLERIEEREARRRQRKNNR